MDLKHILGLYLAVSALQLCAATPVTYLENAGDPDTNCSTPLHDAVISGSIDEVRELIENGADLYALDCYGLSPMHLAIKGNKPDMINELANGGFDVAHLFGNGEPVIFYAVRFGSIETIDALVNLGSDVTFVSSAGNTPLLDALVRTEKEIIDLLELYGTNCNMRFSNGDTILHLAAQVGKVKAVFILINDQKINIEEKNNKNETPLMKAVVNNHPATINFLIAKGAIHYPEGRGKTLVYAAVESKSLDALRVLLENDLLPETQNEEQKPLSLAVRMDCLECAQLLVHFGADIHRLEPGVHSFMNYLHWASFIGSTHVIPFLIESGLDVNSLTQVNKFTPLHIASEQNQLEVAKILLSKGACRTCRNELNQTPFDVAKTKEMLALLENN